MSNLVCRKVSNCNLQFWQLYLHNLLHFFQTQVNITTILGGGFILDIIFEARVNDVATLSEEDKTNIEYHLNSSVTSRDWFIDIDKKKKQKIYFNKYSAFYLYIFTNIFS